MLYHLRIIVEAKLKISKEYVVYDQFASDYDRFVNWKNRLAFEIPFIDNLLQGTKSLKGEPIRVLDAACGTGMHVLALAKAGYDVSGADISCEMVEKARENAATEKLNIRFENAGFGALAQNFGREEIQCDLMSGKFTSSFTFANRPAGSSE